MKTEATPKLTCLTALLILCTVSGAALPLMSQQEATVWHFSQRCGLDFSKQPPEVIQNSVIIANEGSASIADPETGELLFYTDGIVVWDRRGQIMPNSSGFLPVNRLDWPSSNSTTQAALVVPHPSDRDRYYVFNPGNQTNTIRPSDPNALRMYLELSYQLVDMSLRDGLGEIIETKALTPNLQMTERLTGTGTCSRQGMVYWVLTLERLNGTFYAFRIDPDGLAEQPVTSQVGEHIVASRAGVGQMKLSPDGTMLAVSHFERNEHSLQLFRFNPANGRVSDPLIIELPDVNLMYGLSFSPDNSRLYVAGLNSAVHQLTVSNYDEAAIRSSIVALPRSGLAQTGQMQIGPDGRIYLTRVNWPTLDVINFPNRAGLACELSEHSVRIGSVGALARTIAFGLPNFMDHIFADDKEDCVIPEAAFDVEAICAGECASFTDRSTNGPDEWQWSFEGGDPAFWDGPQPPPICYDMPGEYEVTLDVSNRNGGSRATQIITIHPPPELRVSGPAAICAGASVQLEASGALRYEWEPEEGLSDPRAANPIASPARTTNYRVTAYNEFDCVSTASVQVEVRPWQSIRLSVPDSTVTPGEAILLPLELDVAAELLPVNIEFLRFDIRVDARLIALQTVEGADLVERRLEGEEEVLTLELRDIELRESHSTAAFLRLIGLISLLTTSDVRIGSPEVVFPPSYCMELETVKGSVGIHEYCLGYAVRFAQRLQMQVQPNPAQNDPDLRIRSALSGPIHLRLVNSLGRSVMHSTLSADTEGQTLRLQLKTKGLPAGLYFLTAENGGQVERKKLILR